MTALLLVFAALTGPLSVWIIRWGFNAPPLSPPAHPGGPPMTYAPMYSAAPAPTTLRARLRRANLRRRLSPFVLALAFVLALVGLLSGLYLLLIPAALSFYLGVRWSGEPLRALFHVGPLEWL